MPSGGSDGAPFGSVKAYQFQEILGAEATILLQSPSIS